MTRKEPNVGLESLPSVDALLRSDVAVDLAKTLGSETTTMLARKVCLELRSELLADTPVAENSRPKLLAKATASLEMLGAKEQLAGIRRVINATGVILHTNLGRAPLAASVRQAMEQAAGYCTVEYELARGERGPRGDRANRLLAHLTGAEAALIVNNGAAAALLVLTALASGGEVVLSRGELVEIGGDFRIPDVMLRSGAELAEVGTTNRTKLADYASAITPATRMLMRVHPSNYRVVGFTAAPDLAELAELAHRHDLILYEDAGSGQLIDLSAFGLVGEPIIKDSIAAGADLVSFSGDKLLGGVQAGLIVGRRELIDMLRRHPLYRALRPDKIALAAVEATLNIYRRGTAVEEIPALSMISAPNKTISNRAAELSEAIAASGSGILTMGLIPGNSAIGGGSAPTTHPTTTLLALVHTTLTADQVSARLRENDPPVIARIVDDRVVLDLRTVSDEEEIELRSALIRLASP